LEEKPEGLDVQLADFDGVVYHLTTPDSENKNIIRVSMGMKCYRGDLEKYGATQILLREYGDLLSSNVEQGYDVSIIYDERSIPPEERGMYPIACQCDTVAELVRRISYLKCNAMSAPFEKAFESQLHAKPLSELMAIHYREEESIWINAMQDRVTVIFSVRFRDETDKIFGKVFLQVTPIEVISIH
jgi:actin related protein 2/3 complex subunit 2